MNLEELGWDARWGAHFEACQADGLEPARVSREEKDRYHVLGAGGEWTAEVTGRARFDATTRGDLPAVGDWVAVSARPEEGRATIHAVLPRRSQFRRKTAGAVTEEQVLAANVDQVFLVSGLDRDFNPARIERYLALAWDSGASPVVVLNKADLCPESAEREADVSALCPGAPVHAVSAVSEEGLDGLRGHMRPGRTIALLGSSGVGKSTLINALYGEDLLDVGAVRASDGRGRHTTTSRQLMVLPGAGVVIDTPGMRELQLWADEDAVGAGFADVEALAEACRFRDCTHHDEPGCAVREAVEEGRLPEKRLTNYHKLLREARYLARRQDVNARRLERSRWRQITKSMRHHHRERP